MITIGSLFSGIGGLDLGVEAATGGRVIWQAESSEFCRKVLARHWPGVQIYEDVRNIDDKTEVPTIICGGFPCQDISGAGVRRGIDGPQSGLWSEFARIVRLLGPAIVVVENVSALAARGIDRVLGDLAACRYDAEWSVLRAADVGAPHLRRRIFIVAVRSSLSDSERQQVRVVRERRWEQHDKSRTSESGVDGSTLADTTSHERTERRDLSSEAEAWRESSGHGSALADAPCIERKDESESRATQSAAGRETAGRDGEVADSDADRLSVVTATRENSGVSARHNASRRARSLGWPPVPGDAAGWERWVAEGGPQPGIRRGSHGSVHWAHRIAALGNAVVPAQAEVAVRELLNRPR